MVTIVPSPSATIGQVARFIQLLERQGVAGPHIQRLIDDPELRDQVVDLMRDRDETSELVDLSGEFHQSGLKSLVNHLGGSRLKYCENRAKGRGWILEGNTRDKLATTQVVRQLFENLTPLQRTVTALRMGLTDGQIVSPQEVGRLVGISVQSVNRIRSDANLRMKARLEKDFPLPTMRFAASEDTKLWELLRQTRASEDVQQAFDRSQYRRDNSDLTVGYLVSLTWTEAVAAGIPESVLDVLVETLEKDGFSLAAEDGQKS